MYYAFYFLRKIHDHSGRILYLNLISIVFISLLESFGIFMLIPLIGFTGILENDLNDSSIISFTADFFKNIPETASLSIILFIYLLIIIGQGLFQRSQTILSTRIQQGFIRYLREETYKLLLTANWNYFIRKKRSDITNSMLTEIARVSSGTNLILQFAVSFVFSFIQIAFALWLSTKMTLFVMICGIVILLFGRRFVKQSGMFGVRTLRLSKLFMGGITDHFNGIKDIKSNSLESHHINWFENLNKSMEENMIDIVKLKTKSQLIYKIVSAFLIAIFTFIAIKVFTTQSAELMLILIIFSRVWPRFITIQSTMEQLEEVMPTFKSLMELQNECLEAKEVGLLEEVNKNYLKIEDGIECKAVHFRYNLNEQSYALKDINLKIKRNNMTAIVGSSGAGKSTLIDIIMGLNKPERGLVLIDKMSLQNENLITLRKSVSYVSQDPFLFNSSVRDNLLLIRPGAEEKDIWEALEFAAAADFVRRLPEGLDTQIGDRGIRLSGGERQRLVLARAILKRPAILVLDEATSALDSENEAKIQEALEKLKGKMTIIVIAHRLSTIKNADQVIVLDRGRIIQQGGFSQLASDQKGVFSKLLEKQMEAVI
jgi:ABC-type multidrug transport system fused ATPase/permease subunit